jgi:hypothetical protein
MLKRVAPKKRQSKTVAQLMNELPPEVVKEIRNALPPPSRVADMNCGKFINTMSNRYTSLQDYKEQLRTSVVKTFEKIESILFRSFYLRRASMVPSAPSMYSRIDDALKDAHNVQTVAQLVNLCKQVPQWKQEAKLIIQRLEELAQYMEQYLSTGRTKQNVLGTLRLFPQSSFTFFRVMNTYDPSNPAKRRVIVSVLTKLRENLQKDYSALATLSAPLQIPPDPRNCGEYVLNFPEYITPREFEKLKTIVLQTLRLFARGLDKTKYIKKSSIFNIGSSSGLDARPMKKRVEEMIARVQSHQRLYGNDSQFLIDACRQVDSWKRESALIVRQLEEFIEYLEAYLETGKRQKEPLRTLVVDAMNASMHSVVPKLDWKKDGRRLRQYIGQYKACVSEDKKMLLVLCEPGDVR